jgi:flagellar biosynthesis protein FlhF
MRLKSFHAPTMADAMRQVRDALGDDAIIVAARDDEAGGVRVTAAIDDTPPPPPLPEDVNEEPSGFRFSIHDPDAPPQEPEEDDVAEIIANALYRHGTPAALSERLMSLLHDGGSADPVQVLAGALDGIFNFDPLPQISVTGPLRPTILVGPPGAGKTLCIAKLATRAALQNQRIGVISTDTFRAGGIDQLSAFTRILGLPLTEVEDAPALKDAIAVQKDVDQILIDTSGRNPFDPHDMAELRQILTASQGGEAVLVLPGGLDAIEAGEMARAFRAVGVRRLLVTRLDITRRLGSLLSAAHEANLTFCDGSNAAHVTETLIPLSPGTLARLMLPSEKMPISEKVRHTGTHV